MDVKILFLLLITTYSSNCENHEIKCTKKTTLSFGPLVKKLACYVDAESEIKIHEENASVTFADVLTETKVVAIKEVEIWHFPNIIQSTFPNLTGLEIVKSQLKKITVDNFKNLTQLIYLDLSGNEIEDLDKKLFQNNLALTEIHLKNNKIKKIHATAFDGPQKIDKLELQNNVCFDGKFNNTKLTAIIEKIRITCWNQYELMEKIEELQKHNTFILSNLTSKIQNLTSTFAKIDTLQNTVNTITDILFDKNISLKPTVTTTTTAKPESYIAEKLNISLSSIPIPFTSMDISFANFGVLTLIFLLLLSCICFKKTPKPIENLKTIVIKSSDFERMKGATTLKKSVNPEPTDDDDHHFDVPIKIKSVDSQIRSAESVGSFEDVLDEEQSGVQTDWSVAYKTEDDDNKE